MKTPIAPKPTLRLESLIKQIESDRNVTLPPIKKGS